MDSPTLAEVARRVDEVIARLEQALTRLESQYVRFDVFVGFKEQSTDARTELDRRITALESRQEWLVRVVGAIVLAAVLGLVYNVGKVT